MDKQSPVCNTLAYNSYRAFKNASSSLASAVSSGDKKSHEFGNRCIQQLVSTNTKKNLTEDYYILILKKMQRLKHTKAILCQPQPHGRHFGCQTLAFLATALAL
jgi:hypothetical protein